MTESPERGGLLTLDVGSVQVGGVLSWTTTRTGVCRVFVPSRPFVGSCFFSGKRDRWTRRRKDSSEPRLGPPEGEREEVESFPESVYRWVGRPLTPCRHFPDPKRPVEPKLKTETQCPEYSTRVENRGSKVLPLLLDGTGTGGRWTGGRE